MNIVVTNAKVFNVYLKKFIEQDVWIKDGKFFYLGNDWLKNNNEIKIIDAKNKYMIPGLIDIHMHIESSMTTPYQFSRQALKHGVTTVIADPHEIANVFGLEGIVAFMNEESLMDIFYGIPSSVPSTNAILETTGGKIGVSDVEKLLLNDKVKCLGEVMNFKDLVAIDNTLTKQIIKTCLKNNPLLPIEGHCPKISGIDLAKYIFAGVDADHTMQTPASILEKISNGMFIEIQHKSINKENIKIINENDLFEHIALITDDVMPDKLIDAHLNQIIKDVMKCGMSIENAIYCSTYTPARRMNLIDRGSIAPNKIADFILLDDLNDFKINSVYKNGECVVKNGKLINEKEIKSYFPENFYKSVNLDLLNENDFKIEINNKDKVICRVIEIFKDSTFTKEIEVELEVINNQLMWKDSGLALIMIFNRYENNKKPSIGLVKNSISKKGAIATTWAHDHHNLLVIGTDIKDMVIAANEVIKSNGAYVVVKNEKVMAKAELNVGGIVSDKPIEILAEEIKDVRNAMSDLGYIHMNSVMSLSTLSLPVSPQLKITDKGLIDVVEQKIVSLLKG